MSNDVSAEHWPIETRQPELTVIREPEEAVEPEVESLSLTRVAIEVLIHGYISETSVTLTFFNPHGRELAGNLDFPLPEEAFISGYALDIDGNLVDGVSVEKHKGRRVFEKIVRQGIDPGLVEKVQGNNFKTRIYPIPARGTRTVRIRYIDELVSGPGGWYYHLPLAYKEKVDELSLRVEVVKQVVQPQIKKGGLAGFAFSSWRDSQVAEARLTQQDLTEDILIQIPDVEKDPVKMERTDDGAFYFCLNDFPEIPEAGIAPVPRKVAILWDASGSGRKKDRRRELDFIRHFFKSLKTPFVAVDLVRFHIDRDDPIRFEIKAGNTDDLIAELEDTVYDGATRMSAAMMPDDENAPDYFFLFSDGLNNYGEENAVRFPRPLYVFTSDSRANHSYLKYLAQGSGGEYFNLNRRSPDTIVPRIGREAFYFLGASVDRGEVSGLTPDTVEPVHGRFTLWGKLESSEAEMTLRYGLRGEVTREQRFTISKTQAAEGKLLELCRAGREIDRLELFPEQNKEALINLGRQYGLVTSHTSLIVLDDLEQYLEHEIRPPETLPEFRSKYDWIMAKREKEEARVQEDKLEHIMDLWNRRIEWWQTEFEYPKDYRFEDEKSKKRSRGPETGMEPDDLMMEAPPSPMAADTGEFMRSLELPPDPEPHAFDDTGLEDEDDLDLSMEYHLDEEEGMEPMAERVGSGTPDATMAKTDSADEPGGMEAEISIEAWNPDTPYLKEMKKGRPEDWWRIYKEQREIFGDSPAFYLDCGNFLLNNGQYGLGLRVLTNVAELDLENAALLRVLAHKLCQMDLLDESISMFEHILKLRPEEPQSYRDLALALSLRAEGVQETGGAPELCRPDFQRALELLAKVVMDQWDRFAEIELIALMEFNRLVPKAGLAGVTDFPLDTRLIKLLDLDVRIVLTWDADMTDLDLWVTEPSGERAYYGHSDTRIGGHVSRDFTDGYGPEEYIIRRAMPGTYKIEVNYFGSQAPELTGPVTLQVDIFTDFARLNEERETLTLRLTEHKETIKVGEINFVG